MLLVLHSRKTSRQPTGRPLRPRTLAGTLPAQVAPQRIGRARAQQVGKHGTVCSKTLNFDFAAERNSMIWRATTTKTAHFYSSSAWFVSPLVCVWKAVKRGEINTATTNSRKLRKKKYNALWCGDRFSEKAKWDVVCSNLHRKYTMSCDYPVTCPARTNATCVSDVVDEL